MIVATYTQGRKLQNHVARIGRITNIKSPNFGKYFLDVVKEYGTSRNDHGVEPTKDITIIENWLSKHGFVRNDLHDVSMIEFSR
jgi:hypothetical protein